MKKGRKCPNMLTTWVSPKDRKTSMGTVIFGTDRFYSCSTVYVSQGAECSCCAGVTGIIRSSDRTVKRASRNELRSEEDRVKFKDLVGRYLEKCKTSESRKWSEVRKIIERALDEGKGLRESRNLVR